MADSKEYIIRFFADRWETVHELIRCKECKHWYNGLNINYCRIFYDDNLKLYQSRPDDYCSKAERKEE